MNTNANANANNDPELASLVGGANTDPEMDEMDEMGEMEPLVGGGKC